MKIIRYRHPLITSARRKICAARTAIRLRLNNQSALVSCDTPEKEKPYGAATTAQRLLAYVLTYFDKKELPTNIAVDRCGKDHHGPNLWIVGSSVFTTSATADPTLTIAALTLRTAAAIHREMQEA